MTDIVVEDFEVIFAVEGERKPRNLPVRVDVTVAEFITLVNAATGRTDLSILFIEGEALPLAHDTVVSHKFQPDDFRLFHAATPGDIKVAITFNAATKEHPFRPHTTMEEIVVWAISEFHLTGDPADFQLKHGDEVLPPGEHLGQVAHGKKEVRLSLVMKIKPQGADHDD